VPGHRRPPVVTRDHRGLGAQCVEQAHHIADQVQHRVSIDLGGRLGPAVPAHVGRDGVEPRVGQGPELVTPRVPGFRKSVAEHDERPLALLGDVHPDAVGVDAAVPDLAYHDGTCC
jgi:hypothetical protein